MTTLTGFSQLRPTSLNSGFRVFLRTLVLYLDLFPEPGYRKLEGEMGLSGVPLQSQRFSLSFSMPTCLFLLTGGQRGPSSHWHPWGPGGHSAARPPAGHLAGSCSIGTGGCAHIPPQTLLPPSPPRDASYSQTLSCLKPATCRGGPQCESTDGYRKTRPSSLFP